MMRGLDSTLENALISSWRLSRFKSVYDETTLAFAPLTLFSGINNSGKSTIIQSILLTSQSIANPVRKRPVSLNGNLVRLGTFTDIVSNGQERKGINIGFTLTDINANHLRNAVGPNRSGFMYRWDQATPITYIDADFTFSANTKGETERKELVQLQPILEQSRLRLGYRAEDGEEVEPGGYVFRRRSETSEEIAAKFRLPSFYQELDFAVKKTPKDAGEQFLPYLSKGETIGAFMNHFIPRGLLARYDEVEEESKQIVSAFMSVREHSVRTLGVPVDFTSIPEVFRATIYSECEKVLEMQPSNKFVRERSSAAYEELKSDFSPGRFRRFTMVLSSPQRSALLQSLSEQSDNLEQAIRGERSPSFRVRYQELPPRYDAAAEYVSAYFGWGVKYLAPLRDEPKPVYPLAVSSEPSDIGLHGEHTAAVLDLNRAETVQYIPSAAFSAESMRRDAIPMTLGDAVLDWMKYMGVVTDIKTHDLGNRGHELKVATGSKANLRDLTHVGVGVSQVLPIVVLCLLSKPGSILIFEQPELHLHPRVQSRLADFFLSMTFLGKQCIVETHSEHLINRLRLRSASSSADDISKQVMMYFVEAEDGRSKYLPMKIGPYGTIQNWPKGFFDEAEENSAAILRAGMSKRKAEANKK